MTFETFSVWASSKGMSVARARKVYNEALAAAQAHPRTSPAHWHALTASLSDSTGLNVPRDRATQEVQGMSALATHLRRLPGSTIFVEEGQLLVLRYSRNASNGLSYPFSDYSDFELSYNTVTNLYTSKGIVFGMTTPTPLNNEPGVFFMQSLEHGASFNAVVRDFLHRALRVAELYGGQNLDLFTYKLQTELRAIGVMERLDKSKMPNVAQFSAANVQFTAWFAMSSLGLSLIKFNPALTVSGYMVCPRTFQTLIAALDQHVTDHQEFVKSCIEAVNRGRA